MRHRFGIAALGALLLLAAPAAPASTVTRTGATITFTAAPGEANFVSAIPQESDTSPEPQFFVTDRANRRYDENAPPPNTPAGPGCVAENGLRGALCGTFPVSVLVASLGDMNDVISDPPAGVAARYDGGAGNDQLSGGNLADVLIGGPGNDILKGNGGADTIDAGPGRDIVQAGSGNDVIKTSGDHAVDVIDCGPGRDKVTVDKRDRPHRCEKVVVKK